MVHEIRTRVDDLIAFLQGKDRVPLQDAAKALETDEETVQSWVDFLVEEGLLGIEYKFTRPFIYLNRPQEKARVVKEEVLSYDAFHEAFLQKAHDKQIPDVKAAALWKSHVLDVLEAKKAFFYDEARRRSLPGIDSLWNAYKTEVLLKI